MQYDHILIRYGEITTKGKNRSKFISLLKENVKYRLKKFSNLEYEATRDRMYIKLNGVNHEEVINRLQHIFGIYSFSLSLKVRTDLEEMKQGALAAFMHTQRDVRTFKVSVRRSYKNFPLQTNELNQKIGEYILQKTENMKVNLHHPDIDVRVEVHEEYTYIMCEEIIGAGGLPVGVSGRVMLLLSGGIDSPVAGYLTMKRGVTLECIHFHTPPFTSDRAKQKVIDLARELTRYCKRITLHIVPFTEIQKAIHKQVPDNYTIIVMRRMMLRIADRVAAERGILALATGESLGQVASQTLDSMHCINEVTNYPILRPLIATDKLEIMKIARQIDTYDISIRPYEDCCTIFTPSNPTTKPKREKVIYYEQFYNFEPLIEDAIKNIEKMIVQESETKSEEFQDLF